MNTAPELLEHIKGLINAQKYRVRLHAVRHMIEEGFSEQNLLESITGRSKILEHYPDELRCLIAGSFRLSARVRSPLHSICDYSNAVLVDIVMAYIPQKPWWRTPTKRGRTP
jgi:hypothetical protein